MPSPPITVVCSIGFLVALAGCASFSDVEPGKLKAANCVLGLLRTLPDTKAVDLYVTRHYRESVPVIGYEYQDASGRGRFTWFEIGGDGPDEYLYFHPGNAELAVTLPDKTAVALNMQCHVMDGQVSVT